MYTRFQFLFALFAVKGQ